MNDNKYFLSGPEEASSFMEWEGDSNLVRFDTCIGEDGTSPTHHNLWSTNYCLPNTLGYTSRKRKYDYQSSPLPMKMSRNFWNGEQREEDSSVNEIELHKKHVVASGFSIDKSPSQMTTVECRPVLGEVSDNVSTMSIEYSNVCTVSGQSNSGTFQTHPDLEIREEKITHPLNVEQHIICKKEKPYTCPICHSKWFLQTTLKRHIETHRLRDGLADTKHF